jgi:hypothetical protein
VTLNITRPVALGMAAVLLVVVAALVVHHRHGEVATVAVAPLSSTDRQVLTASRSLIESIPTALAQVPNAASDASGGQVSVARARAILAKTPALSDLSDAVANPASVVAPLSDAYQLVLAGRSPGSVDDLAQALQQLQTVEGQIEPAIRVIAAHGGTPPTAAAALDALEADRQVAELARLVAGWQQVYGAFTLVEQAAVS